MAKNEPKRIPFHYGLEFVLANEQATIQEVIEMLAKRNRIASQERAKKRPGQIAEKDKPMLRILQREKMKVRNRRTAERQGEAFK